MAAKTIDPPKNKKVGISTNGSGTAKGSAKSYDQLFQAHDPLKKQKLQILDENGKVIGKEWMPNLSNEKLVEGYKLMLYARIADLKAVSLQRQGRVFTLPVNKGQEAAAAGSAMALEKSDWMVPAFRELAALLSKGANIKTIFTGHSGNELGNVYPEDIRLLPNTVPISSQLPHAAGIGYTIKYNGGKEVVITYFGDGGTSEGDFSEAVNFAAVFSCPVIFFCNNNQYAISVPREIQTKADTIAQKAVGYGIPGIQVDGNDFLSVYAATEAAVERARAGQGPTLIEAVTYRLGAHTTSDDPTKYRTSAEEKTWEPRDPLVRMKKFLISKGLWDENKEKAHAEYSEKDIDAQFLEVEKLPLPDLDHIFGHVFETETPQLKEQREEMERFLKWKESR